MKGKARSKPAKKRVASARPIKTSGADRRLVQTTAQAQAVRRKAAEVMEGAAKMYEEAHEVERGIDGVHQNADAVHQKAHTTALARTAVRNAKTFPIVGIGASAGGLEAMTQLVRHLPRDTGMAFVLVQHLDPTHESQLTSLLARSTSFAVSEARNNVALERNHLYVIPPNKMMVVAERKLRLLPRKETRTPIDYFFRSLAEEEGPSSVGVILSGNGSDGTMGLQAIKAAGGITFAQDEATAKYPTMPGSAIAARCVDFVLSPEKIARELTRVAGHPYVTPRESLKRARPVITEERAFEDILATVRQRTGVDFTHYKRPTLQRRIQRRIVLHKFEKLKDYANYVHSHATEAKELFNDILIHVTSFFRDPRVFAALKKRVFPRIFKIKKHNEPIRIWVPGCSTGEEVYSIAITLMETLSDKQATIPVQIFGTDINDMALQRARAGIYPECIHENVSPERLRQFFVRYDGGYCINKSIRDLCIFARQNVVVDPPFSSLDLISCRNMLIYLDQPLQRKIMPVFHYALKPTGLLMLGSSETIGSHIEMFQLLDNKSKIYAKRTPHVRPAITFGQYYPPSDQIKSETPGPTEISPNITDIQRHADRILLTNYSPAGVIINREMEVLQFRGKTGPFLEHAHGEATLNLLKMAREGLTMDLRAAVSKAMKQNTRVRHEGARARQNSHFINVTIEVVPFQVASSRERFYLVLLDSAQPSGLEEESRKSRGRKSKASRSDAELNHLREELAGTHESLQAIIEAQEATNEELRSANEEIMSSNEELQSTNEELETAKEELQSTNEELITLNEELETRNTEMTQVNNDLHNVMSSVNIPMLLLGRDLRIRRFTGAAEKLFHLIPADVGRPITDIAMKVEMPDLHKIVVEVIETLATKEIEAKDGEGRCWFARIRPYKTTDNKIDGAVIALMDVNAMKVSMVRTEEALSVAEAIINTVREPLMVLDQDLTVKQVNQRFLSAFKVGADETMERRIYDLGNGQWNIPKLRQLLEEILPKNSEFRDFEVEHDFPRIGRRKMLLNARRLRFDGDKQLILLAIEEVENGTRK